MFEFREHHPPQKLRNVHARALDSENILAKHKANNLLTSFYKIQTWTPLAGPCRFIYYDVYLRTGKWKIKVCFIHVQHSVRIRMRAGVRMCVSYFQYKTMKDRIVF